MDDMGMDKRSRDKVLNQIIEDKQRPRKSGAWKFITLAILIIAVLAALSFVYFKQGGKITGNVIQETKTATVQNTQAQVAEKHLAEPSELIAYILDLRDYSNSGDIVKIADSVSWLNQEVENYDAAEIKVGWQAIVGCAYQKCSDADYLSMIDAISIKQIAKNNNGLIHSLIETFNLWNGKNQVYFSDSLSTTNALITGLKNASVTAAWNNLVTCNGICETFSSQTLGLIKLINSA
ncbi:MAG: hypothetical protein V1837_02375 [Candidatus Woesearchaeota archaeon]